MYAREPNMDGAVYQSDAPCAMRPLALHLSHIPYQNARHIDNRTVGAVGLTSGLPHSLG